MKTFLLIMLTSLLPNNAAFAESDRLDEKPLPRCKEAHEQNCRRTQKQLKQLRQECMIANPDKTRGWCRREVNGLNATGRAIKEDVQAVGKGIKDGVEIVGDKTEEVAENVGNTVNDVTATENSCHKILRKNFGIVLIGDKAMQIDPKKPNVTWVYSSDGAYKLSDGKKDTCGFAKAEGKNRLLTRNGLLNKVAGYKSFPKNCKKFLSIESVNAPETSIRPKKNPRNDEGGEPEAAGGAAAGN